MKLYHYTNINALINMLSNSISIDEDTSVSYLNLYAKHISLLDDKNEFKLYTGMLKKEIVKYANNLQYTFSDIEFRKLNQVCSPNYYTTSLTDSCTNSFMWGNYADNYAGICLEFDFDKIPIISTRKDGRIQLETAYNFRKCKYVSKEDITFESEELCNIFEYITSENKDSDYIKNTIKGAAIIAHIANKAIIVKGKEFTQEQEFRYSKCSNYILDDIKPENKNCKTFLPIPTSIITAIILGSGMSNSDHINNIYATVRSILGNNVEIKKSECKPQTYG